MPRTDPAAMAVTVVEDEPLAQDVLVRAARLWQYDCQTATSAEQALELLEKRPTPIVVTDLRMPGKGGVWLVREVRRRWPDAGIIVITAGHDTEAAVECLNAGADHYFLKPIKLDEFRHALEATRRTYELQRENERYRRYLERTVCEQMRRVRSTFLSAIDSLVRAMEERDPSTAGHSLRVRRYSLRLAKALALDRKQTKRLALAAKLHDIGKVGIPEAILHKEARLTAAEDSIIRDHPIIGERILRPIVRDREVLAAIRGHHERLDGLGYPDGLRGEQVPLLARVITIADCFDALTSARPYRDPLTAAEALDLLRAGAGTQFQAEFVQAFVEVMRSAPAAC
ncbi:MAG TPA: HD domain-containing phosphohydrolase [Gemmataceae bacterium]|nr:HD domain-containing phosphohydrolase [Gemmataceae bacterium]